MDNIQPQIDENTLRQPVSQDPSTMPAESWRAAIERHRLRLAPWAERRRAEAGRQVKNPVYDFLFEYYAFRPAQLLRWTPGVGILLKDARADSFDGAQEFRLVRGGMVLRAKDFPEHRRPYLEWAVRYLENVAARSAVHCCFGLHEWAMLYRADVVRHAATPLRLPLGEIATVLERSELRCTHYDAFRFFTPHAVPMNKYSLTRESTPQFDQPGCIHVTMDLYKFAHKIAPFCPAELVADSFELAAAARTIDMRASPYDLRRYGLEPIQIEDASGREAYVAYQRDLTQRAEPIRLRLIEVYRQIIGD